MVLKLTLRWYLPPPLLLLERCTMFMKFLQNKWGKEVQLGRFLNSSSCNCLSLRGQGIKNTLKSFSIRLRGFNLSWDGRQIVWLTWRHFSLEVMPMIGRRLGWWVDPRKPCQLLGRNLRKLFWSVFSRKQSEWHEGKSLRNCNKAQTYLSMSTMRNLFALPVMHLTQYRMRSAE